mmetsp:Transcript_53741/g.96754  ORF Transcript_53741/g.96754 Transcript_53741/m.96754 type:complete len:274 (-) Transcript_53741:76-897(-)
MFQMLASLEQCLAKVACTPGMPPVMKASLRPKCEHRPVARCLTMDSASGFLNSADPRMQTFHRRPIISRIWSADSSGGGILTEHCWSLRISFRFCMSAPGMCRIFKEVLGLKSKPKSGSRSSSSSSWTLEAVDLRDSDVASRGLGLKPNFGSLSSSGPSGGPLPLNESLCRCSCQLSMDSTDDLNVLLGSGLKLDCGSHSSSSCRLCRRPGRVLESILCSERDATCSFLRQSRSSSVNSTVTQSESVFVSEIRPGIQLSHLVLKIFTGLPDAR